MWAKLPSEEKAKWAEIARSKNEEVRLEKERIQDAKIS